MQQFGLSDKQLQIIRNILARYPEVEQAIIYGSRVKGSFQEGSDIDLTLKGKLITQDILSNIWNDLEDSYTPYLFDLSIYQNLSNQQLIESIDNTGKVFYQRENL